MDFLHETALCPIGLTAMTLKRRQQQFEMRLANEPLFENYELNDQSKLVMFNFLPEAKLPEKSSFAKGATNRLMQSIQDHAVAKIRQAVALGEETTATRKLAVVKKTTVGTRTNFAQNAVDSAARVLEDGLGQYLR